MSRNIPLGVLAAGAGANYVWSWNNDPTALTYRGAAYAPLSNAQYFGFGGSDTGTTTTSYVRTTDPLGTWTVGTMPAAGLWNKAATNGSRLIVSRESSTTGAYTDNGTTWTLTTFWTSSQDTPDIIFDGTRFLALGQSSNPNLAYSTDGVTWTRIDIGDGFHAIAYDGSSRYVALVDATTNIARTVTGDPTIAANWANITLPSSTTWRSIAFGNDTWLAVNHQDVVAASTNGTTWTTTTVLPNNLDSSATGMARVIFADNKFWLIIGGGGAGFAINIYSSINGTSWVVEGTIPPNSGQGDFRNAAGWGVAPSYIFALGYNLVNNGASGVIVGKK